MVRRWSRRAAHSGHRGQRPSLIFAENDAPAEPVTDLSWTDLLPLDDPARAVSGIIEHEQIASSFAQPAVDGCAPATGTRKARPPAWAIWCR